MICEHFKDQTLKKTLSVHEPTHQMQTYCKRKKKNHFTLSLIWGTTGNEKKYIFKAADGIGHIGQIIVIYLVKSIHIKRQQKIKHLAGQAQKSPVLSVIDLLFGHLFL